jgi:hypothetical protein
MNFFGNLTLGKRLGISFGILAAAIAAGAGFCLVSLLNINAHFKEYKDLSNDSNLAGDVQAHFQWMVGESLNYTMHQEAEPLAAVAENRATVVQLLKEADGAIQDPERRKMLKNVEREFGMYAAEWDKALMAIRTGRLDQVEGFTRSREQIALVVGHYEKLGARGSRARASRSGGGFPTSWRSSKIRSSRIGLRSDGAMSVS